MKKTTTQLLIAGAALAGALALAAYASPVFAATTCNADVCPVKPWREFRTENDKRDYLKDMTAAQAKCSGKNDADKETCISDEMKAKGWKPTP